MSKTNDLRKLVTEELKKVCSNVYYERADEEKLYPHIVFSFHDTSMPQDMWRDDVIMNVDVWDKGYSAIRVEDLCDEVEKALNGANKPQESILPTFFYVSKNTLEDEDKSIRHRVIKFQIQNYERNE